MEKSKSTTKEWFECPTCGKKLETINMSGGTDLFGLGSGKITILYCDNKECDKYGYLTVAGVKKSE